MTPEPRIIQARIGLPGETGILFEGRSVDAKISLKIGKKPNKAKVTLYNLNADSIGIIRRLGTQILVSAGETIPGLLFSGQVIRDGVSVQAEGGEVKVEIEAQDGLRFYTRSTVNLAYPRGTSRATIMADVLAGLGLPLGHVSTLPAKTYPTGWAYSGRARDALTQILHGEAVWSIQHGRVQILTPDDRVSEVVAPVISPETTLIGSPDQKTKDRLKVKSLLLPMMIPGAPFMVRSEWATGDFEATEVEHEVGDGGTIWVTSLTGKRLK